MPPDKYLKNLAKTLIQIKKESEMENFLKLLFTPSERKEIPRRLEIIKLLKRNIPQRKIAKDLDVSVATISRGSREIKYGDTNIFAEKWWKLIS